MNTMNTMGEHFETEPWAPDTAMFRPSEEQILLNEKANCIAVEAFLKMCDLPCEIETRPNAEYMSPTGGLPFIKCGNKIVSEIEGIVDFVKSKNISLTSQLGEDEPDVRVYMNHFHQVLTDAELYFIWCHEKITKEYTSPRFTSIYPWPLGTILYLSKKRNITKRLESSNITSYDEAIKSVDKQLSALSDIIVGPYFFGKRPTELDALVFGHLSAIQITALPDDALSIIVKENRPLVDLCNLIGAEYFPGILTTKD